MPEATYLVGPILSLILVGVIVSALLRKKLRERHAGWWLFGALVALILSLFPSLLEDVSRTLGVVAPLNLAFVLAIAVIFFVSLQHSAELTRLEERVRTLAEHVAELEMHPSSTKAKGSKK